MGLAELCPVATRWRRYTEAAADVLEVDIAHTEPFGHQGDRHLSDQLMKFFSR
jgi:hypothetical protein